MDHESWIELAMAACNHANISPEAIETIATWDQEYCANAVYRVGGQRYLKIYGPTSARQYRAESSVLRTLEAHPTIPAPRIAAEGELTPESPYLFLTEVAGVTAEQIWDSLARTQQLALARDLGSISALIHRLPQEDLAAVEGQFGGRREHTQAWKNRRIVEIEATQTLSVIQRDALLRFLHEEAWKHFDDQPRLTHRELAHNHIYLAQDVGIWQVTGIIDWADAMLGPPEWDVTYLWFWTFSRDHEPMRACLQALYADSPPHSRFARRCMAATLYTPSMRLLWPEFAARGGGTGAIERDMIAYFFPPDLFGPPD